MITFAATATLLAAFSLPTLDAPPIFVDLGFEAAMERATKEDRVLVLDAMTSWCGPCKQMDATTWIDPRLEAWADSKAIAIQLDMDEHEELKNQLKITAFPTIIMFRGGEEFDRVVGSRTADQMLEWIGAASEGKRASDVALERLKNLRLNPNRVESWNGRSALVADLMWFQQNEEALVEFDWLWRNLESEATERQLNAHWNRHKYTMRDLVQRHAPSRASFEKLRAEIAAQVASDTASQRTLRDWIELNFVLGEEATTAAWADRQVAGEAGLALVRSLRWRLFDLLVEHDHWRTAGLVLGDVVAEVQGMRAGIGAYDEVPAGAEAGDKPQSIPAIPMMGSPRPAAKQADDPAPETVPASSDKTDDKPKSMPAIPMTGSPRPASKQAEHPAPETVPASSDKPKSMPMIPMGGMRPASKSGKSVEGERAQQAMPAIPMGGAAPTASQDVASEVRWRLGEQFRNQASDRYAALLAADRTREAESVSEILLAELNGPRTRAQLVHTALRAGSIEIAKSRHLEWLAQIAQDTSL